MSETSATRQSMDTEAGDAEFDGPPTLKRSQKMRIGLRVVVILTLAIMGGAQLPLGAAFASTGLLIATLLVVLVGVANAFTSDMLCWQAYYVGRMDFEQLGQAIGGRWWRFVVELFVFILLLGVMISVIQQVGEVWAYGMSLFSENMPTILTEPRFYMLIGTALCVPFIFVTRLSTVRLMRLPSSQHSLSTAGVFCQHLLCDCCGVHHLAGCGCHCSWHAQPWCDG